MYSVKCWVQQLVIYEFMTVLKYGYYHDIMRILPSRRNCMFPTTQSPRNSQSLPQQSVMNASVLLSPAVSVYLSFTIPVHKKSRCSERRRSAYCPSTTAVAVVAAACLPLAVGFNSIRIAHEQHQPHFGRSPEWHSRIIGRGGTVGHARPSTARGCASPGDQTKKVVAYIIYEKRRLLVHVAALLMRCGGGRG